MIIITMVFLGQSNVCITNTQLNNIDLLMVVTVRKSFSILYNRYVLVSY